MKREQKPVMQAIVRRRGLAAEIARRIGRDPKVVRAWVRVPLRYASVVSELTGIPVEVMRREHLRADTWRIPLSEVLPPAEVPGITPRLRRRLAADAAEQAATDAAKATAADTAGDTAADTAKLAALAALAGTGNAQ
jgi:hypothetical protein